MQAWKLKLGGNGRVIPPMRSDGQACDQGTLRRHLRATQEEPKLPTINWYQSTRHTFASHGVMNGGTLEKPREMLGHSTVQVTERYAHLKPDLFGAQDLGTIRVDMRPGNGEIVNAPVTPPDGVVEQVA